MTQEKGKVPGEEQDEKMSVFYSVSISKPSGDQAPNVSAAVRLLENLSCGVLLKRGHSNTLIKEMYL